MLLEPLVSTIETIKERIATHGPALRQNETRTRAALIDPLLQALGWDVSDPSLVTPEYRVDVGWADYALLRVGTQPVAVIEAKRLGSIVENHLEQAVGYCIQQGIAYAGVTDGNHWQLYRTFEPVPLADKLVLDLSISDAPSHESALKLLLLWHANLASGQPATAEMPVLGCTNNSFAEPTPSAPKPVSTPVVTAVRRSSSSVAPPIDSPISGVWIPLSEISQATVDKKPARVRFAGHAPQAIRSWVQVLIQSTEWLCKEGTLTREQCPIGREGKGVSRFLVSTNPVHKNGANFAQPYQTSTGLFLEVNHSARSCVNLAKELLNQLGVSPEVVQIQLE